MNFIQAAPMRGRRGYVGRGRMPKEIPRVVNIFPKYQFDSDFLRPVTPVTNSGPTSSNMRTPRRRENCASSSSYFPSTSRRSTGSVNPTRSTPCGTSSNADSYTVIALTAGRGDARNEVGLAAIDLQYPYLILCQISDCQTYVSTLTKINNFDPIEILMPETMCGDHGGRNKLCKSIKEKFSAINVTPISRTHFNESTGMERVRTLCAREYSTVELIMKQKYYALAATAALLKYVEYVQHMVYVPKSLRIEFQGAPNATIIDLESARSLELVVSQSKHSIVSLLGTMDRCLTPMGRRLLRASILQPPCDERLILDRQSCVAELVANRSLCTSLQPVVQRLFGADRLLSLATKPLHVNVTQSAERNLNYVLLLKNCLDIVPELEAILAIGIHPFFVKTRKNLKNSEFLVMKDKILTLIQPDARFVKGCTSASMQRCFAIKAGINQLLDVARQIYCELIDDMRKMVEQLAVKHKLPLSLEYNVNMGYHIHITVPRATEIPDLPVEFIQTRRNRRSFTMTTTALLTLNKQCKGACEEIYTMSNTLLTNLLEDIRQHVGCLFQLSADVAEMDLVLSLAQISCNPEYVRPLFGARLELRNSFHPIMELFNTDLPVPNDADASAAYNFHLITGPNMSGKSTYLKQIVLLQIMAQIGSYVPASKALFRVSDRILCRICSRDDTELNMSSFVLEMKETQYILQSITPKSIVVLDELCRHTMVEEGSSIAWAIYERLLLTPAFTFATTHFLHLVALGNVYHNVTTHCFETKTAEPDGSNELRLIYTHKLNQGKGPTDHYGIALAEVSSLPKDVTTKAREYASRQSNLAHNDLASAANRPVSWEKSCYDAVARLHALLENDRFTFANIIDVMRHLDLDKRGRKKTSASAKRPGEKTREFAEPTGVAVQKSRRREGGRKDGEEKNSVVVAPRDNSMFVNSTTMAAESSITASQLTKIHSQQRKGEQEHRGDESRSEMVDPAASTIDDRRRTDLSIRRDSFINRTAPLSPDNGDTGDSSTDNPRDITPSPAMTLQLTNSNITEMNSQMSCGNVTDDPLYYVRVSFSSNSQTSMILSRCKEHLESNPMANPAKISPPIASQYSGSFKYYDYCLSEQEFDITLPSQSSPNVLTKMNARGREAEIFRQIEGDAFDEAMFFDDIQVSMESYLNNDDDDVEMTPA